MKKIAFAALAVLGIVLGTVKFAAPAHAFYFSGGTSKRTRAATTDAARIVKRGEAGATAGLFRFQRRLSNSGPGMLETSFC